MIRHNLRPVEYFDDIILEMKELANFADPTSIHNFRSKAKTFSHIGPD